MIFLQSQISLHLEKQLNNALQQKLMELENMSAWSVHALVRYLILVQVDKSSHSKSYVH